MPRYMLKLTLHYLGALSGSGTFVSHEIELPPTPLPESHNSEGWPAVLERAAIHLERHYLALRDYYGPPRTVTMEIGPHFDDVMRETRGDTNDEADHLPRMRGADQS